MAVLALARVVPHRALVILFALLTVAAVAAVAFAAARGLPVHHVLGMHYEAPEMHYG